MKDLEKDKIQEDRSGEDQKGAETSGISEKLSCQFEQRIMNIEKIGEEQIVSEAERTLRVFVEIPSEETDPTWYEVFKRLIRERLDKKQNPKYVNFLYGSHSKGHRDVGKDYIIAHAICYELERYQNLSPVDQTMAFKVAARVLTMNRNDKELEEVIKSLKEALSSIGLKKLSSSIQKGGKYDPKNERPFACLAQLALERKKQEPEEAAKILDTFIQKHHGKGMEFLLYDLTQAEYLYSPELFAYALEAEGADVTSKIIDFIKKKIFSSSRYEIRQIDTLLKNLPMSEQYFTEMLESIQIEGKDETTVKEIAAEITDMLQSSLVHFPESKVRDLTVKWLITNKIVFAEFLKVYRKSKSDRLRAINTLRSLYPQLQDAIFQHEKSELEIEEESKRRKAEAKKMVNDQDADTLIENLPRYEIEELQLIHGIKGFFMGDQHIDSQKLICLCDTSLWPVLSLPHAPFWANSISLVFLEKEVEALLALKSQQIDQEKQNNLKKLWLEYKPQIQNRLIEQFITEAQDIGNALTNDFKETISSQLEFLKQGKDLSLTKDFVENEKFRKSLRVDLNILLQDIDKIHDKSSDSPYHLALHEIKTKLLNLDVLLKQKIEETYQKLKEEDKIDKEERGKEEREIKIDALKRTYLLELVEKQTDYLKELYALETGLDLAHAESHAESISGEYIASVSLGTRHELKLEQRPLLLMELETPEISIEMGDDLESAISRMGMINWACPHEIAHLVNWAHGNVTQQTVEEKSFEIDTLIESFDQHYQQTADEILKLHLQEIMIDGIAYSMICHYGTTNPADKTIDQRKVSAIKAFEATSTVYVDLVHSQMDESTDEENQLKARYSCITLRMIAVGLHLGADIQQLNNLFQELNAETEIINEVQKSAILAFYSEMFNKGFAISRQAS